MLIFGISHMIPVFSSWISVENLELNFVPLVQKKEFGMGCNIAMKATFISIEVIPDFGPKILDVAFRVRY